MIGDERLTIEAVQKVELPIGDLTPDLVPARTTIADRVAADACKGTMNRLWEAMQDSRPLAALRSAGVDRKALSALRDAIDIDPDVGIDGRMSDEAITAALDRMDQDRRRRVLAVVAAVLREVGSGRDTFHALRFSPKTRKVHAATLRRMRDVKNAALLLMDGTGDEFLNGALAGASMTHDIVRVERDADVTGTLGRRRYSRQSVSGLNRRGDPIPSRVDGAERLREEIGMIAAQYTEPLIVATMGAEEALISGGHLPGDAGTTHFGDLLGKNCHEERLAVIKVGQELVSIEDIELIAGAFHAADPVPLISIAGDFPDDWPWKHQWPCRATRMRRMRNGGLQPVDVDVHPDPRVQRVLEQVREAQAVQGIDRVRPIFNHRDIVAMDSLVLDLTYDRNLTHRELVNGGDRIARAWSRDGVLPLTPADLAEAFPTLFVSAAAARWALRQRKNRGGTSKENSIWSSALFFYRRPRQRGRMAQVLIGPRYASLEAAKAAVVALLGPLAAFQAAPAEGPEVAPAEPPTQQSPGQASHARPATGFGRRNRGCQPWMMGERPIWQARAPP